MATTKKKTTKKALKVPSHPLFCIRLSPEEKAYLQEAAEAEGFKSLSTWIKHTVRRRAEWLQQEQR